MTAALQLCPSPAPERRARRTITVEVELPAELDIKLRLLAPELAAALGEEWPEGDRLARAAEWASLLGVRQLFRLVWSNAPLDALVPVSAPSPRERILRNAFLRHRKEARRDRWRSWWTGLSFRMWPHRL